MKALLLIVYLLCATAVSAVPEEKKEVPAFPNAIISIEGPHGEIMSSICVNDLVRAALPSAGLEVSLPAGSQSLSINGKNLGELSWRFVARTEFGDIYLVYCTTSAGKEEASSLLFDEKSAVSWRCIDWRIGIHTQEPIKMSDSAPTAVNSPA